jgi:hypothetical protein
VWNLPRPRPRRDRAAPLPREIADGETAAGPGAPALRETPVLTPLRLKTPVGLLSLFSTTTLFGMPQDVTLDELAIESFFPADEESAALLAAL